MTGCDTCDRHGPELDGTWLAWLDLHRSLHDLGRALTRPLYRYLRKATR